jgi:hypothetical protein
VTKYSIPRIFFKKYFYILSPKTFCFLIKLYQNYLDGSAVTYQDLKEQIFDNYQDMEEACAELIKNEIIMYDRVYNKKKNHYKYILTFIPENKIFEVIYTIKARRKYHNITEKYIENILSKFPERTQKKLQKVIEGIITYYLKFKSTVKTKVIYDLLLPFFDVEESVICKVCDIYVNKHYEKKPIQYVHAILRNVKQEKKTTDYKTESLDYFRKKKEELRKTNKL